MRAAAPWTRPVRHVALALAVALGAVSAVLLGPQALLRVPGLCIGPDCAAAATAYLTPSATGGAQYITLIYEQRGARYASAAGDLPLVAHLSPAGRVLGPFLQSFLFLSAAAPSGATYANPHGRQLGSDMADWRAFLRTTFQVGLPALDRAVATARPAFRGPVRPLDIFLMVPYPARTVTAFGTVGGHALNLAHEADREAALRWYVQAAEAGWRAAHLPGLRLAGFYWMREDAVPYQATEIHALAADIHPDGLRLLWIPCKSATYAGNWASYGFDAAVLQPNYYEDGNRSVYGRPTSLAWTANFAQLYHMGVELELSDAVTSSLVSERRFYAYLRQGAPLGYERNALIAIFQGTGAISRLANDPARYWLYSDLYLFTQGRPIPLHLFTRAAERAGKPAA